MNNNNSGPWGNNDNNQSPWGRRPNNQTPPDVDEILKNRLETARVQRPQE